MHFMALFHPTNRFEKIFAGGIIIKGIDGLVEFLSGFVLLFIPPTTVHHFITFLTASELRQDPHDFIANLLLHTTQHFGAGSKIFAVIYLWIHGIIKLIAVFGILKNQLWAYPFSLITLGILAIYQVFSISVKPSVGMILLTIFDVFILWMIWREYGKVRAMHEASPAHRPASDDA